MVRVLNQYVSLPRLVLGVLEGCTVLIFVAWLLGSRNLAITDGSTLALSSLICSVLISRALIRYQWADNVAREKLIILGTGKRAKDLSNWIEERTDLHMEVVGFLGSDGGQVQTDHSLLTVKSVDDIERVVDASGATRVAVALDERRGELPVRALSRIRSRGIRVEEAQDVLEALTGRIFLDWCRPGCMVFGRGSSQGRAAARVKRISDLTLALLCIILGWPLLLATGVAVLTLSGHPIFYHQKRVGLWGQPFDVLKFRTMRNDAEADGKPRWATADDPRITWIGKYLRRCRLDELPQILNVLRGEMSFIGPRPERPLFVEQLRRETPLYDYRHDIRPGITGWAQVKFHYGACVADALRKLEYDLFYVKNYSLLLDCAIVLHAVKIILLGRGAR